MDVFNNQFDEKNSDHVAIWEMLVLRDVKAFVANDWSQVEHDFVAKKFYGINARFSQDPLIWTLEFPNLLDYQNVWSKQSLDSKKKFYSESLENGLLRSSSIEKITIKDGKAAVWKKLDGSLSLANGLKETLQWITVYFCELIHSNWKITGFIGYLPLLTSVMPALKLEQKHFR